MLVGLGIALALVAWFAMIIVGATGIAFYVPGPFPAFPIIMIWVAAAIWIPQCVIMGRIWDRI